MTHAIIDCRACGRPLKMLPTKTPGKFMPCNAETVDDGDTAYVHGKHISHFSDCPAAASFRKPK